MDKPVRKYQKQKDYQRHKLFRKMKRRRRAAIEQAKDAPMKQLRRKLKIPKFEDGKDENKELPYPLRSSKDYDDNLAYQSGIIRDPETGHMWSTTQEEYPNRRTYLKKPNHPTFNKALWGDLISGYDVYFKNGNTYSAPTFSELMYVKPPFKFEMPKFEDGKDDKPNVFQLPDGTFVNNYNEPLEVLDYAGVEDPTKWTYVDKKGNRYTPKATRTLTEGEQFTQRQIENEQNTRPFEFTPYIEGANEGAAAASLMMGFPFNMAGSAYYTAKASRNAYDRDYLGAVLNGLGAVTPAGSGIYDRIKLAIENYRQPLKKLESPVIRTVQDNGKIRLSLPTHTDSNPRQFVLEPQGNNKFYVHMRTWDGDHVPANLSNEDKQTLFQALYDELPDGAEILFPKSGPGYYGTRGTVAGLQRLARDSRFTPGTKGTLQYLDKDGKTVKTYEGTSFIKTPRITAENAANITPEQLDAAYKAAVESGNRPEALRLLEQAYLRSGIPRTDATVTPEGYAVGWYHGSEWGNHTIFDSSAMNATIGGTSAHGKVKGNFLTTDVPSAMRYAGSSRYSSANVPEYTSPQTFSEKVKNLFGVYKPRRLYPAERVGDYAPKPERLFDTKGKPAIDHLDKVDNVVYPLYVNPGEDIMRLDFQGKPWSQSPVEFPNNFYLRRHIRDDVAKTYRDEIVPYKDYETAYKAWIEDPINIRHGSTSLDGMYFDDGMRSIEGFNSAPRYETVRLIEERVPSTTNGAVQTAAKEGKTSVLMRNVIDSNGGPEGVHYAIDDFVTFKPNQQKLADITYGDNGNLIPLSQRFNWSNSDIRYGLLAPLAGGTALLGYNSLGQPIDTYKHGKDSGIHINPKNRGKFNALKKRTGKTTEQLTHSKNPLTRKRAIFAQNAKKWKH